MNIKLVEGCKVASGEVLVCVMPHPLPQDWLEKSIKWARSLGFEIMWLPAGTKVCIKESAD